MSRRSGHTNLFIHLSIPNVTTATALDTLRDRLRQEALAKRGAMRWTLLYTTTTISMY